MNSILWNKDARLILADVDETIAGVYLPASDEMIQKLSKILERGITLFLVSGAGLSGIKWRITDKIEKNYINFSL